MSDRNASGLEVIRRALAMLPPTLRRRWLAVPLMGVTTAATEAGAAAAVFVLVRVINAPAQAATLPVVASVVRLFSLEDPGAIILVLAALVAVYYLAKDLLMVAVQYVQHRIVAGSSIVLGGTMLRGYLLAPYPFHFRRNSAELIRNTGESVDRVFIALNAAAGVLSELLVGIAIAAVLLAAAPGATLIVGATLGAVVTLVLRGLRRRTHDAGRERHELNRDLLQTLQQTFAAVKEIKTLGREEFFYRSYVEKQRRILTLSFLWAALETLPPMLFEGVFVCGALLVIAVLTATGRVETDGLPLLGLFAYSGFRLIPMVNRITWRLGVVRASATPVEALYDDYCLFAQHEPIREAGAAVAFSDAIILEDVSYVYPGAAAPALSGVSLTIRRGESVAFVGATGAGKSTLVDLIVGLLPPTTGRVRVDDTVLTDARARAWRRQIGYVPQSVVLIDDSLRRNVALGIGDAHTDPLRLQHVLEVAQLQTVVAGLADGLDAGVGERGMRLSGGERQRLGIARALYHDPTVLVLDEATAALDVMTETAINDAIRAVHGEKTVLIVAHRLSTVRRCDRIALLAAGRLVDCGTFDELLARAPDFQRLIAADSQPGHERGADRVEGAANAARRRSAAS